METAEKKQDITPKEKEEILRQLNELKDLLALKNKDMSRIEKIKEFFVKYKDLYPLIVTLISTVISSG